MSDNSTLTEYDKLILMEEQDSDRHFWEDDGMGELRVKFYLESKKSIEELINNDQDKSPRESKLIIGYLYSAGSYLPGKSLSLITSAISSMSNREFDKALNNLEALILLNPEYDLAWRIKGQSLVGLERYQEALESFDRALELNPQDWFCLREKGTAFAKLGRTQDALECYSKALSLNPNMNLRVEIGKYSMDFFDQVKQSPQLFKDFILGKKKSS